MRYCRSIFARSITLRHLSTSEPRSFFNSPGVLPRAVKRRLAVEAGATLSWWRYVGPDGRVLGMDRFGASGKASDLFPHFGFTADNVTHEIEDLLQRPV